MFLVLKYTVVNKLKGGLCNHPLVISKPITDNYPSKEYAQSELYFSTVKMMEKFTSIQIEKLLQLRTSPLWI